MNAVRTHINPDLIRIFTGNANPELAARICALLGVPLSRTDARKFADGEIDVTIHETVRGKDVFLVQPTCGPNINDNLMELLVMLDAAKRASAERITAVIPYYGYARQDRKVSPRAPITAKLVANLIQTAGAHRVLTMDLHAGQIQGFFDIPVDNLYATGTLCRHLESLDVLDGAEVVVVSPDAGGVRRARYMAHILEKPATLAIIDKRRAGPGKIEEVRIIGEVTDKVAVLVDDMIDSAGTIVAAAGALQQAGVKRVLAVGTHAVFSGPAVERIRNSGMDLMLVTDTIPLSEPARAVPSIQAVSIAKLFADAIENIHCGGSVSSLFTDVEVIN